MAFYRKNSAAERHCFSSCYIDRCPSISFVIAETIRIYQMFHRYMPARSNSVTIPTLVDIFFDILLLKCIALLCTASMQNKLDSYIFFNINQHLPQTAEKKGLTPAVPADLHLPASTIPASSEWIPPLLWSSPQRSPDRRPLPIPASEHS